MPEDAQPPHAEDPLATTEGVVSNEEIARILTQTGVDAPVDAKTVTQWLNAWSDGAPQAIDRLIPLVYRELRMIAGRMMASESSVSLQPTSLVHEAYLRLLNQDQVSWGDRSHFFAIAVRIMRRVIVDRARARRSWKRGGREQKVPIDEAFDAAEHRSRELLALDDALEDLERSDPRRAAILELRVFGGLTQEETADMMGLSRPTVIRQYKLAKAWLHRYLRSAGGSAAPPAEDDP
ncbi:MAG: sigma-70 family RNA polymerase sigma factor [Acidobacteriota bacterium]